MSGAAILVVGIGMIFCSAILLVMRIVYGKTAGRGMRVPSLQTCYPAWHFL